MSLVIAALLVVPAQAEALPACRDFRATLRLATAQVARGSRPEFTLSIRNTSRASIRLLDTRAGRRRDLSDAYYRLVVRTPAGADPDVPRVISDPGTISDSDFFMIAPGEIAETPTTTALALDRLAPGRYEAHLVITVDPYRLDSRCRSEAVTFSVR